MPPGEEIRTADNGRPGHERTTLKVFGVLKKQLSGFSPEPRVNQVMARPPHLQRDRAGKQFPLESLRAGFYGAPNRRLGIAPDAARPSPFGSLPGQRAFFRGPRVAAFEHDCLLRVNWRWKQRGILTDPDLVLVGDAASLHKLSSRIFGFWNIAQEYGLLLRYLITHGPRLLEYVTMERISPLIRDHDWPARPSNGSSDAGRGNRASTREIDHRRDGSLSSSSRKIPGGWSFRESIFLRSQPGCRFGHHPPGPHGL